MAQSDRDAEGNGPLYQFIGTLEFGGGGNNLCDSMTKPFLVLGVVYLGIEAQTMEFP